MVLNISKNSCHDTTEIAKKKNQTPTPSGQIKVHYF